MFICDLYFFDDDVYDVKVIILLLDLGYIIVLGVNWFYIKSWLQWNVNVCVWRQYNLSIQQWKFYVLLVGGGNTLWRHTGKSNKHNKKQLPQQQ